MTKAIDPYFLEVRRYNLPPKKLARQKFEQYHVLKQELQLTVDRQRQQQLRAQIQKLAQELGTYYLRFVIKKARERSSDEELLRDLISAGNEGLMIAVNRFDPSRYDNQFLTYAAHWVRVKLDEVIQRRGTVHLTPHLRKKHQERGETPPEAVVTPLDDIPLASDVDTEDDATPHGAYALNCLDRLNFSRRTKLLVIWVLGLRGHPKTIDEVSMMFYMLDGSVCLPCELKAELEWALTQFRTWIKAHPKVEAILRLQAR